MPDRLLLLHNGPVPDVTLDALALGAGYNALSIGELGTPVMDLAREGNSCLLLSLRGAAAAELPRFMTLVQQLPETARPYVIALIKDSQSQDITSILSTGIDDAIVLPCPDTVLAARLQPARRFLRLQRAYRVQAFNDSLTGLLNRDSVIQLLDAEIERARRLGNTLAVAFGDLDGFKAINDSYGHLAGDAVLAAVAARMRAQLRPYDAVGRYGGDEFLFLLIGCTLSQSEEVCRRVRKAVEGSTLNFHDACPRVTISLGLTLYQPPAIVTRERLINTADIALYQAKRDKNRVVSTVLL